MIGTRWHQQAHLEKEDHNAGGPGGQNMGQPISMSGPPQVICDGTKSNLFRLPQGYQLPGFKPGALSLQWSTAGEVVMQVYGSKGI